MNITEADYHRGYKIVERPLGVIEVVFTRGENNHSENIRINQELYERFAQILKQYDENEALVFVEPSHEDVELPPETIDLYKSALNDTRIARMAIFGGLDKYRTLASELSKERADDRVNIFDTRDKALKWLLQE